MIVETAKFAAVPGLLKDEKYVGNKGQIEMVVTFGNPKDFDQIKETLAAEGVRVISTRSLLTIRSLLGVRALLGMRPRKAMLVPILSLNPRILRLSCTLPDPQACDHPLTIHSIRSLCDVEATPRV